MVQPCKCPSQMRSYLPGSTKSTCIVTSSVIEASLMVEKAVNAVNKATDGCVQNFAAGSRGTRSLSK